MRFYFPLHFFICSFVLSLICFSYAQLRHAVITSKATNKQTKKTTTDNYVMSAIATDAAAAVQFHMHLTTVFTRNHIPHLQCGSTGRVVRTHRLKCITCTCIEIMYMTIGGVFKRFSFLVESKIFFFVVAKTG